MYECGYYFLLIFQSFNDVLGNRYLFIISEEDGAKDNNIWLSIIFDGANVLSKHLFNATDQ